MKTADIILLLAAAFTAGIAMGRCSHPGAIPAAPPPVHDTIREIRVDTLRIRPDTPVITRAMPPRIARLPRFVSPATVNVDSCNVDSFGPYVDTPLEYVDSCTVAVPIAQHVFTDTATYRAVISGYAVTLDSVEVYATRETLTITRPPRRWGLSVQAGCGITPRGPQPYIGIGLSYTLMTL